MGAYNDFMGRLERVNIYGKKQCTSLFWRVKAAMKKGVVKSRSKKQLKKFQYDPSSYALNFDDGYCHSGVGLGAYTSQLNFEENSRSMVELSRPWEPYEDSKALVDVINGEEFF